MVGRYYYIAVLSFSRLCLDADAFFTFALLGLEETISLLECWATDGQFKSCESCTLLGTVLLYFWLHWINSWGRLDWWLNGWGRFDWGLNGWGRLDWGLNSGGGLDWGLNSRGRFDCKGKKINLRRTTIANSLIRNSAPIYTTQ